MALQHDQSRQALRTIVVDGDEARVSFAAMIDHYTLLVRDYEAAKAFYLAALKPLGYELVMELTRDEIPSLPCDKTCGIG